jgi:superfamily II DNA/RNA helicase
MSMINNEVQTVLFSATMGEQMKKLTTATTRKPLRVSADPDNVIS